MTDYISREAVKQIIAAQCGECADACLEFDGIQPDCNQCLLGGAAKAIKSIPAADVRPVVRGKWIMNDECSTVCSLCGNVVAFVSHPDRRWDFGNYCPNCGADMRGESDA